MIVFARRKAIGYLRADVSGIQQPWHETQMRDTAKKQGLNYDRTVVFHAHTDRPLGRLLNVIDRVNGEVVIVPSAEHFAERRIPDALLEVVAVVTVSPDNTFARTPEESGSHA